MSIHMVTCGQCGSVGSEDEMHNWGDNDTDAAIWECEDCIYQHHMERVRGYRRVNAALLTVAAIALAMTIWALWP